MSGLFLYLPAVKRRCWICFLLNLLLLKAHAYQTTTWQGYTAERFRWQKTGGKEWKRDAAVFNRLISVPTVFIRVFIIACSVTRILPRYDVETGSTDSHRHWYA